MPTIKNHPKSMRQVSLLRPSSQQHAANADQRHHFTICQPNRRHSMPNKTTTGLSGNARRRCPHLQQK
jgi:hypothetical protein